MELCQAKKRQQLQKLVTVLATSASMTETSLKAAVLERMPYICYPVQFQEDQVQALIGSGSEFNAMTPAYTLKLGLVTPKIDIGVQKIDGSVLTTYEMVIAGFSLQDKLGRV